jgi:hypothetical protein
LVVAACAEYNGTKVDKVSPIFVQNSDNLGNWGYAFTSTQPKTYTNDNTVKKISLTSGAWATVNGVDLLTALK